MFRRHRPATADPVIEVRIAVLQERLEPSELLLRQAGEMACREPAEQEAHLPRPAVPASEQQALAAQLKRLGHCLSLRLP